MNTAPSTILFWNIPKGRELDATPLLDRALPHRIVACLNVWNDRPVLEVTVPTWKDHVDHVIVVDGSYSTTGLNELSTDGTREYLASVFPSIEFVDLPGVTQCEKRTAYLQHGRAGDYLFVIDGDERLLKTNVFDALPMCDIGWVRIQSKMYKYEYGQPRLFKWRPGLHYKGRHHWIYCDDQLFCTHQYGGSGFMHRTIDAILVNERHLNRSAKRIGVKDVNIVAQNALEVDQHAMPRSVMSDDANRARESLHILNYAYRDDGLAPSRFHTAINRTTPHASVFFKVRPGPFNVPEQYDTVKQGVFIPVMRAADVIHIHSLMSLSFPTWGGVPLVFHHHGSLLRANAVRYTAEARKRKALVLVSNLELLSWTEDYSAEFLPNTVPVARYLALADSVRPESEWQDTFRVAHSPTHREKKGTQAFIDACSRLKARGYPIEPVLIEGQPHAEALRLKASCHAMFDSFWLGIQCSGIEAAAMRLPVIAGDETVAKRYREQFGEVPYTFANDGDALEVQLARLMDNPQFLATETARVHRYIVEHHDESAVALTYLDYLDKAFHWRSKTLRAIFQTKKALGVR